MTRASCHNHPELPATHRAKLAVAHPPYKEWIGLCAVCGAHMENLVGEVEALDTPETLD